MRHNQEVTTLRSHVSDTGVVTPSGHVHDSRMHLPGITPTAHGIASPVLGDWRYISFYTWQMRLARPPALWRVQAFYRVLPGWWPDRYSQSW